MNKAFAEKFEGKQSENQSLATFDRVSGGPQVSRCFNLFQCVFHIFSTHVLEL